MEGPEKLNNLLFKEEESMHGFTRPSLSHDQRRGQSVVTVVGDTREKTTVLPLSFRSRWSLYTTCARTLYAFEGITYNILVCVFIYKKEQENE